MQGQLLYLRTMIELWCLSQPQDYLQANIAITNCKLANKANKGIGILLYPVHCIVYKAAWKQHNNDSCGVYIPEGGIYGCFLKK